MPVDKQGRFFYAGGFFIDWDGERVLLHHRDDHAPMNPGKWAFFGGGSEPDESPAETCMREIAEETGIRVDLEDLIEVRSYPNPNTGYDRHTFCVERYVEESQIQLTEGQGFAWIGFGDLTSLDMTATSRSDLDFYLSSRAGVG